MVDQFLEQIHFSQWSWLLPWLFGFSVIIFIGSIVVGWLVLVHLPEDYLTRSEPTRLYRSALRGRILHDADELTCEAASILSESVV